jgi:hypothetical protein
MRKVMVQALVIASLLGMSAASATAFPSPSKINRYEMSTKVLSVGNANRGNGGSDGQGVSGGQNNQ